MMTHPGETPLNIAVIGTGISGLAAAWLLAQCGMDPQAGARPLRRLVKLWVEDAVADHLIAHRSDQPRSLVMTLRDGQPVVEVGDVVPETKGTP